MSDLREALRELLSRFPTDSDMHAAGWSSLDIEAACTAYDKARAALSAEPAQEMTDGYVLLPRNPRRLSDEQIQVLLRLENGQVAIFHAWDEIVALAADRASRLPAIKDEKIVSAMLAGSGGDPVWMRLTNKQMIAAGRAVEALVRGKT